MEKRVHGEGQESPGTTEQPSLSDTIKAVEALAHANARAPLDSEERILSFLKSWWCRTYDRPMKDPLLQTYSLEELLYEFYDRIERAKAAEEAIERQGDKIEEDKEKEVLDWAELEEKKELEALAMKEAGQQVDPAQAEENKKWMEEQLRIQKELHGSDFGEEFSIEE